MTSLDIEATATQAGMEMIDLRGKISQGLANALGKNAVVSDAADTVEPPVEPKKSQLERLADSLMLVESPHDGETEALTSAMPSADTDTLADQALSDVTLTGSTSTLDAQAAVADTDALAGTDALADSTPTPTGVLLAEPMSALNTKAPANPALATDTGARPCG